MDRKAALCACHSSSGTASVCSPRLTRTTVRWLMMK